LRLEHYIDTGTIDVEIVNALFLGLHTVKGSTGMVDFKDVQEVAHKLENLFDLLRKERMPLSEACINVLFEGRDFLTDLVHAAVDNEEKPAGVPQFIARLDAFAAVYESTSVAIDGNHPPPNADQVEALAESRCLRLLLAGAHQAYAAWGAAAKIRRLEADHPFLRGSRLAPAYSAATTVV
jgi:chemotaxis protein histidine kinase CheA